MVDMHELKFFLGISVERTANKIMLSQCAYLRNILNKFNMVNCKPVGTSLSPELDHEALNSDEFYDAPCRNLIGCLMYAMLCTRSDLCLSVNLLSRFQVKNNKELWANLKRVLRYLKGSLDLKLTFERALIKWYFYIYVLGSFVVSRIVGYGNTSVIILKDSCRICWDFEDWGKE